MLKVNKKGFTLVELITVLAILAIILTISLPFVNGYVYDSKLNADKSVAMDLQNAIDVWMHIDRSEETDKVSYSYLNVSNTIGGLSEYQYYNKYAGEEQLPGTEFTNETDIRKAVLSAMKSVMGNKLIVNSDWTIESPKAGSLLSYRYYYRLGLVKVVEFTQKEENLTDELEGYYITLDKVGYSNIASNKFDKFDDTEILSTGIEDKAVKLYGLDVSSLGITEGLIEIWDLGNNVKTTCAVDKLGESDLFTSGLYYVIGKLGDTVTDVKFLLALDGLEGKCYSFESFTGCNSDYIQKIKDAINKDEDKVLSISEVKKFIEADDEKESKKLINTAGATESDVGFDTDRYVIDCVVVITPTHIWGDYTTVVSKTFSEVGTHNRTCTDCGLVEDEQNCENRRTITEAQHIFECNLCGNTFADNHTFGDYESRNSTTHYQTCACGYEVESTHSICRGRIWTVISGPVYNSANVEHPYKYKIRCGVCNVRCNMSSAKNTYVAGEIIDTTDMDSDFYNFECLYCPTCKTWVS